MKLIVIGSSSKGNAYALQAASGEILLLEAGRPIREVKKAIGYQTNKVVGCIVSHTHTDHAKYIPEYFSAGIDISSCEDVANRYHTDKMDTGKTYSFGSFKVTPFAVEHDVANYGYLVFCPDFGSIFFATDCYNLHTIIKYCRTYLMECNYEDSLLNKAIDDGKTSVSQADRIRLSHMSLDHAVQFLQQCEVDNSTRQIILIHGSSRHLQPSKAVNKFQQVLGVPTYYASKGFTLDLI